MMTVVERIGRSGLRTLMTRSGEACLRVRRLTKKMAGAGVRVYGRLGRSLAAGAALWAAFGAAPANASERDAAATVVHTGVGTMPLLAAMGIGIAIAALAVIAFLQMTTKARIGREPDGEDEGDAEQSEWMESLREPHLDARTADGDDTAADLEDTLPDFTIPVPAMRERPEPAALAEEGAPRLWGVEGEFAGSGFKLSDGWLTLGRDASQCGLIFPCDAGEVSRKHCSLKYEEGRGLFLLEDHHSSNGTFLSGGERLEPGVIYELRPGSRFSLSGERHWFEVQI